MDGFDAHKLKGGVYPPDYELECYRRWPPRSPRTTCALTPTRRVDVEAGDPLRQGDRAAHNDYYEDPTWGLNGMRQVREAVDIRLATNTVVV